MDKVILKQGVSIIIKIVAISPIFFIVLFRAEFNAWYMVLFLILIPVFGFNIEYVFYHCGKSFLILKIFNMILFSRRKYFISPEYLSVTHQAFIDSSDYVLRHYAFLETKFKLYTIKFFNGYKRETVFKTSNKEEVVLKANELSKLLNVRINNKLK